MAGRPRTRNLKAQIDAKAQAAGQTPLDYILGRIEGGEMVYEVAEDVADNANMLRQWAYAQPDGRRRWQEAMAERSHALVEQGVKITRDLKGTEVTKEEVALSKLEIEQLNLIARAHNRPVYGNDAAQVNVQVNMGSLHLDALRQMRMVPAKATPQLEAGATDYEVVTG